ncbi:hypothetical protein BEL04_22195 [Mucilaginibacter sp. PPCGB 2223]|uniref:Crp/Fnr family transcriptional regulator n=1 Tax=Mucilaginibacter sp. PPCGB 2223 TaxID=1886027 RepID=UPI0008260A54|nr:Crp/Fnr family transcriptional regulator [Mucilaginibacter sp. PPCGB 2223]OCX50493.1 hypothetical protein BEL04_22195 [Mucilaginibacter sp. PPCGB 2223]
MYQRLFDFLDKHRTISEDDKKVIMEHSAVRNVFEGEVLLMPGQRARELFFICNGILRTMVTNSKGDRFTQFFVKEDHFCTILYSFNDCVPAGEGIEAACNANLIVFTRSGFESICAVLPWFRDLFDGISKRSLMEKIKVRGGLLGEDATTRYQKFRTSHPDIAARVSLTDIASYLEITPQSLSRIRRIAK